MEKFELKPVNICLKIDLGGLVYKYICIQSLEKGSSRLKIGAAQGQWWVVGDMYMSSSSGFSSVAIMAWNGEHYVVAITFLLGE